MQFCQNWDFQRQFRLFTCPVLVALKQVGTVIRTLFHCPGLHAALSLLIFSIKFDWIKYVFVNLPSRVTKRFICFLSYFFPRVSSWFPLCQAIHDKIKCYGQYTVPKLCLQPLLSSFCGSSPPSEFRRKAFNPYSSYIWPDVKTFRNGNGQEFNLFHKVKTYLSTTSLRPGANAVLYMNRSKLSH